MLFGKLYKGIKKRCWPTDPIFLAMKPQTIFFFFCLTYATIPYHYDTIQNHESITNPKTSIQSGMFGVCIKSISNGFEIYISYLWSQYLNHCTPAPHQGELPLMFHDNGWLMPLVLYKTAMRSNHTFLVCCDMDQQCSSIGPLLLHVHTGWKRKACSLKG